jgi:hypothetical protein
VLDNRCSASSGDSRATSAKAFPLAVDPSGALGGCRTGAKAGVTAIGPGLFKQISPCTNGIRLDQ